MIRDALQHLERGDAPPVRLLVALGEPAPARASAALATLARIPELAGSRASWGPALLLSGHILDGAESLALWLEARRRCAAPEPQGSSGVFWASAAALLANGGAPARALFAHPEWALDLAGDPPPAADPIAAASWSAIQAGWLRGSLRVSARDLLGCPWVDLLAEVSDLTWSGLHSAFQCAASEMSASGPPSLRPGGRLAARELGPGGSSEVLLGSHLDGAEAEIARRLCERVVGGLAAVGMPPPRVSEALSSASEHAVEGPEDDLVFGPGGGRRLERRVRGAARSIDGWSPERTEAAQIPALLRALAERGPLEPEQARALTDAWQWLRRWEAALATSTGCPDPDGRLPAEPVSRLQVARRMGYRDPDATLAIARLESDATRIRGRVASEFPGLAR